MEMTVDFAGQLLTLDAQLVIVTCSVVYCVISTGVAEAAALDTTGVVYGAWG